MKTIGGLFGRSAFGPLHEQAIKVHSCVQQMAPMTEAWVAGDWAQVYEVCKRLHDLESEADDIKQEIRGSLSHSVFGSVDRAEILQAVKSMDSVADRCEDAGKLLEMRRTPCPAATHDGFPRLAKRLTALGETLVEITSTMRELPATGTDKGVVQKVLTLVDRAHREEYEADVIEQTLLKTLFEHESEVDPVSVMMVVNIGRELGEVGDEAENTADVLRRLVSRR